jgi:predicted dehydrogenase
VREVGFGLIGGGLMGREFASAAARWAHLLDMDVRPRLVAVADLDESRLGWFRANFPVRTMRDYQSLLADPEVEAVYCAVPHDLHERLYVDILDAGKHLLGEKPFGIDQPANERILAAARVHPQQLVRCSSEFPFYPGAQRLVRMINAGSFGRVLEVRAGFLHSSDMDPAKPISWKRQAKRNGAYGCLGDLGLHVLHIPLRAGWMPSVIFAVLSKFVHQRPGPAGEAVACDTWDNAILLTEVDHEQGRFPMTLETKRMSPGDTNTWYLQIVGTEWSASFSTKQPKTLRTLSYVPGQDQAWRETDLGYESAYPTITGGIFEFGFSDALLQMWAAYCDELVHGETHMRQPFRCITAEETALQHRVFTAALASQATRSSVLLERVLTARA